MRTLIIGGAASGKSEFAENLVTKSTLHKIYLASANIYDEEMQRKVEKHKIRRGNDWETISEPLEAKKMITNLKENQIMLFDCATMWLTNQVLIKADMHAEISELIEAIGISKGNLTIVTNEVGSGIVPDNSMAREFRELQGLLNQRLALICDSVIKVIAGLPLYLKKSS